jgi:hypothetical protein
VEQLRGKELNMDYLLFGGASSVGKSGAIIRLESYLNSRGRVTSHKHTSPKGFSIAAA